MMVDGLLIVLQQSHLSRCNIVVIYLGRCLLNRLTISMVIGSPDDNEYIRSEALSMRNGLKDLSDGRGHLVALLLPMKDCCPNRTRMKVYMVFL